MPSLAEHQQQRALFEQLRASNDPQAQQQAAQLHQLYYVREMAGVADDVYDAAKGEGRPEAGWIRASEHLDKLREYAPKLSMTNDQIKEFLHPKESGFRAEIYLPDPTILGPGYKPTLVFKGSSGQVLTPDGLRDTTGEDFLANNFPQAVGLQTDYYDRAMRLASALTRDKVDFELAAHSLGGGAASAAAAVTGAHATTFNAAGLHPNTARRFAQENGLPVYDTQTNVVAYQVAGEVLNDGIQQNIHRLDAFRREELGGVLKETSAVLKELPQGKALLASQLNATVPAYAQPSVHAFLDRLEQGDTAQLLRELPLAAGQPQPLLAAKQREYVPASGSQVVDRPARLSLREASDFAGPMLDIVSATAQGARLGRGVGGVMAQAGHLGGQGMEVSGELVDRTAQAAAQTGQRVSHALGDAAAQGVERAAALGAQGRQALGEVQASAERVQGRIEGEAAGLGAAALRQAGAILPQGLREQAQAQAGRLEQAGAQAQQRGQADAAHAVHAAAEHAQDIRRRAHAVGGVLGAVADQVGRVQHDVIATVGSTADATLGSAGRHTQAVSAQLPGVYAAQGATAATAVGVAAVLNPTTPQGAGNLARTGVFASQVSPSAKEATDRHLMTETVLPSLDARIQELEHKARQQLAPERGSPPAPGMWENSGRDDDTQTERARAASPAVASEHVASRAAPAFSSVSADLRDPAHPGHVDFKHSLREVHYMEAGQGIASGPHSEKVAAALLVQGEREGLRITNVAMGADGQVQGLQRLSAFDAPKMVQVDPRQAQAVEMHDYANQWAQLRSPHLLGQAPAAERTPEQAHGIAALSAADQALFARIRQDVPAHIGDDHVAQAMLGAKQAGIADAGKIDRVLMAGDSVWVAGVTPGFRASTDVSQPPAPIQDTVQQAQALNQQREQQVAMELQQRQQEGPGGRGAPVMG
jgi:hypothetical protein